MAAETIVIDIIANFRNNTSSGMDSARSSADRFTRSMQSARREAQRLGGTNARPRVSLVDRATSTLTTIDRSLTAIGGKTVRAGVKVIDYATRPLRAIKNALFSIKGLVAAIGSAWAANKLISEPLSLADAYSGAKIGFSTLLGDTEGQAMMDKLDEFAKATPFTTSGVIENAQKMMSMGWSADTLIDDMKIIGDAAAATGKGTEGLDSIVRALSQIKTKGKLSTEELNQLAEAGIAAKAMLAEQLGYGTGDTGIAKMTEDLEDGAIASDKAIQALLQGMKQFDGTMERTANETVEGLKSQLEDTFEINILRRWGQGLQDGAKRGLGSVLELLDKSEGSLEKFGDTVYEIGKELSNWAADKLENTIDKIIEITNRDDFKNASLGGKIKILWDEVIAEPFGEWWDSKGKPYIIKKMESFGEGLGSGLSKGLLALLGISDDVIGDSLSIGGSFAKGFAKGFEGEKVWDAIIDASGKAFKAGFSALFNSGALGKVIATGLAIKVAAGITNGISTVIGTGRLLWSGTGEATAAGVSTLAGGGIRGAIGSTGNAMVSGHGILGNLASLGYAATGGGSSASMYFGSLSGTMSGGMAALAGAGTAAGIIGGVAGLGNSVNDLSKAIKADTKNDKKLYGSRAATKASMVSLGATIGTLIAPGIGTAIGAGLGGLATFVAGNKLADSVSGVSKSTAELNEEAEELASKRMEKRFGEITLSADELSERVQEVFGTKTLNKVNNFNQALSNLNTVSQSTNAYQDDISYTHARIMDKESLSTSDIEDYQASLQGYADSVDQLLSTNKKSTRSAFQLLYGDDTKGLQKMTKTMNSTYSKLEERLAKKSNKLNKVIADAFSDGKITIDEEKKINELVEQIEKIQDEVEKRLQKEEEAQAQAAYDLIGMKYKDTDLTADSFKSLISELDKQAETNLQAYDDAFVKSKAEIDLELELGEIDQKEYNKKLKELEQKWREGKATTIKQSVEVSLDVLNTNYSSELNKMNTFIDENVGENSLGYITTKIKGKTEKNDGGLLSTSWDKEDTSYLKELKSSFLNSAGVDDALQKEMSEMYESLKPQEEDLLELKKSYQDAGQEIPTWIEDSLANIENIKLMSGDTDSFYKRLGEQIAKDDKGYAERLITAKGTETGKAIPQALIDGINEGLKNSDTNTTVEYDASLKVTADKKNIDTSGLDNTTKDVVEKLEDKGIIYTKEGKVKVKMKDGKIDTTDLDDKTKKALEALEKEGLIEISKDGKVTFNTKEVDVSSVDKALEFLKEEELISIDKEGKVTITADGGIDYDDVNKKTQEALDKLKEDGVININKEGKVTVNASVDTSSAKEKADNKTKSEVGQDVNVNKTANVAVDSNTAGTEAAAEKSKNQFIADADAKFKPSVPETGKINVTSVSLSGASEAISTAWSTFKQWVKDKFSIGVSVTSSVRVNQRMGTTDNSSNDPKKANGGYVDKAIRTIVGEAGPEMIIPLSANRRQRGKALWERAGRAMGLYEDEKTYMNANGGLYGVGSSRIESYQNAGNNYSVIGQMLDSIPTANQTETPQKSNGNSTVKVDVGGITINIQSTGKGVQEDIASNSDAICSQIATMLENAFQNMPISVSFD